MQERISFSTAIGYHPMRHVEGRIVNLTPHELQYRKREFPHAASNVRSEEQEVVLLQYRNRVSPHAAALMKLHLKMGTQLQYRNRVFPHAALKEVSYYDSDRFASIPQQGYPLCGGLHPGLSGRN